jgi:hypothetical protein
MAGKGKIGKPAEKGKVKRIIKKSPGPSGF